MARKTQAERLKRYQSQIELAQKWRTDSGFDDLWNRLIELYKGKHYDGISDEDRIAINVTFSTINVIFPAISVSSPHIMVSANQADNDDRAIFCQAILNYWWDHYDFQKPFRRAAKDFLVTGHGWMKIGWRTVEGQRMMTAGEIDAAYRSSVEERDRFVGENPDLGHTAATNDEIAASLVESTGVDEILEDRPFMERVSPFDMFVDPNATCLEDARWIAQRLVRPLEDVRDDRRYKQSTRLNVKGAAITNIALGAKDMRKYRDELAHVVIWEHYDLVDGKLCIFAEGNSDFLVAPIDIPYAVGHPFAMIRNYDVPELRRLDLASGNAV